jgi:hypothetical protein
MTLGQVQYAKISKSKLDDPEEVKGKLMTYKNLIYETDERVRIIKVNRPEVRNVFNLPLIGDVVQDSMLFALRLWRSSLKTQTSLSRAAWKV